MGKKKGIIKATFNYSYPRLTKTSRAKFGNMSYAGASEGVVALE